MNPSRLRRAGIVAPLWCLRREEDHGIGDTKSLRKLIDWAAQTRVGFIQLLPLNETGSDHSPYNAISSIALEPSYLTLEEIPWLTEEETHQARVDLGSGPLHSSAVDYEKVKTLKRRYLRLAFERFWIEKENNQSYQQFCEEEKSWLQDYSLYRVLMDCEGGNEQWEFWSQQYNTREKAHTWLQLQRKSSPHEVEKNLRYYQWVQWISFQQWKEIRSYADERDVKLMGDVPIGVSYHSVDVFFEPEWFDLNWSGGAPPETVFKDDPFAVKWGQNWGVPLYRWDVLEQHDYSWWRRRIEKLTTVFQMFRIDHILGFYRIYAFPWRPWRNAEFLELDAHEAAARMNGRLPGFAPRADDNQENAKANLADGDQYLQAIIKAANGAEIIGEDLGFTPDYVPDHLKSLNIAGFRICHWEINDKEEPTLPENYEECSFAAYSTHDHPTMAGLWEEFRRNAHDPDEDVRAGAHWNLRVLSRCAKQDLPDDGHYPLYHEGLKWGLIEFLLQTRSRYAACLITDLDHSTIRFNIPGTTGSHNWSARLNFSVEDLESDPSLQEISQQMKSHIIHSLR